MKVTLPDGTPLELPDGASGADLAAAIGPGLARAALAVKVRTAQVRDLAPPLLPDGAASRSSPIAAARTRSTSSATTPRTCSPPR